MLKSKILIVKKIVLFLISFKLCSAFESGKCSESFQIKPRPSNTREVLNLDGIWHFYKETSAESRRRIFKDLNLTGIKGMPGSSLIYVPSTYNEISSFPYNYSGGFWFEKKIFIPEHWTEKKISIRLSGVSSLTGVWWNGLNVSEGINFKDSFSIILEIPFDYVVAADYNRITFSMNHQFTEDIHKKSTRFHSEENVDECEMDLKPTTVSSSLSIQHSAVLFTTPYMAYIKDIIIETKIKGQSTCQIDYHIITGGYLKDKLKTQVSIYDQNEVELGTEVIGVSYKDNELKGTITIKNCNLWWPVNMLNENSGYLYTLKFELKVGRKHNTAKDTYWQKIGIRELSWSNESFKINNKDLYLRGFNHNGAELGSPIGLYDSMIYFKILKSFAYNYLIINYIPSEEMLDLADQYGILLILDISWLKDNQDRSKILQDFVCSYKNHPSIIAWSMSETDALIFKTTEKIDPLRPFVLKIPFNKEITRQTGYDIIFVDEIPSKVFISPCHMKKLVYKLSGFDRPVIIRSYDESFSQQNKQTISRNNNPLQTFQKYFKLVGECSGNLRDHILASETDGGFNFV